MQQWSLPGCPLGESSVTNYKSLWKIKTINGVCTHASPTIHQAVLRRISITESPRKNILLINLSLLTGFLFFPFGTSVHISFTFSNTMLLCLSKSFTRANSFLLLRREIRTCVWFLTDCWRTERGPWLISCSSSWRNWASSSSDFGTCTYWLIVLWRELGRREASQQR